MYRIAGLPAHPLIVHVPVVLIPLLAIGSVAYIARARWREALGFPLILLALVTLGGTLLAANSGDALRSHIEQTALVREHADEGGQLEAIAAIFCGLLIATILLDLARHRTQIWNRLPGRNLVITAAFSLTILLASGSVVADVRAGHSGAKAVWSEQTLTNSGEIAAAPPSRPNHP